jgi:hypothetical protein
MRVLFRSRVAVLAAAAAGFASVAFAQSAPDAGTRTFYFQNITTVSGAQQVANTIRTVVQSPGVSLDSSGKSLTVSGAAAEVAMAAWLFQKLDNLPAEGAASPSFSEYPAPGTDADVMRVYRLANALTPQGLGEITNAIRTTEQLQYLMPCAASGALAMRGTSAQLALAGWLIGALDKPAGWQAPASQQIASYEYAAGAPHEVRVFYMAHADTPQALTELTNVTRTLTWAQYLLPVTGPRAIVERATPHRAELTQWLVEALDKPPGWKPAEGQNPARSQFAVDLPGNNGEVSFVRVFYLPSAKPQELTAAVNRLRAEARMQFIMPDVTASAIILRGDASQVAQAEQMLMPPAAAAK